MQPATTNPRDFLNKPIKLKSIPKNQSIQHQVSKYLGVLSMSFIICNIFITCSFEALPLPVMNCLTLFDGNSIKGILIDRPATIRTFNLLKSLQKIYLCIWTTIYFAVNKP